MKRVYLFSVLIAFAIFGSCSKDITEESKVGSIAGSVSDRTTGEPVATVNVSIAPSGSSTVTGSDGTFTFRNLEEGSYTLTITKEGYKQNSSTVTVRPGDPTSAHLLIERIPAVVTADRDVLDFGDNASTNTLSFNIVNPGYVDLEWEIENRCEWITEVKPAKGTLKYGKTEAIVVVIDRELLASGPNEAVIVVRSSNGSSDVKVTAVGAERYVPQLNTLAASEIKASSVTLNGEITNEGVPTYTERGFVYSLNSMPTFDNMIAKVTSPVTSDAKYSYQLNGLSIGQTYYVRAYATNSIGTAYSTNEITFTTLPVLPSVSTLDIIDADIQKGTATFRGLINSAGEPTYTERGFVYGTVPYPTINDYNIAAPGIGVEGSFSIQMSNLPTSTYYVRAYAINQGGIAYGEQKIVEPEWVELSSAGIAVQKYDIGVGIWSNIRYMCSSSITGGYNDWRLPNKEELMSIYASRDLIGNFVTEKVDESYLRQSYTYHSSDTYQNSMWHLEAYYVDFRNGQMSSGYAESVGGYYCYERSVRCVRTLNKE